MFRSILVPLDGSELAEQALPLALSIARSAGAELTLLQVVPSVSEPLVLEGTALTVDEQLERLRDRAGQYLDGLVRRLQPIVAAEPDQVSPKADTAVGHAAAAIAEYASANHADLIVMATHGRSGLTRWTLGSVTHQVLQLSRAPLLIVRPQSAAPVRLDHLPTLHRLMITLDGSELAERVLPIAAELGRLFQSELLLFRAAVLPAGIYYNPEWALLQLNLLESAEAEARDYLQRVASSLEAQGVKARMIVASNSVVDAILATAQQANVDVIAMTTHGRTGLSRLVYGSVTDRVVKSSVCPVLVVRPSMMESG